MKRGYKYHEKTKILSITGLLAFTIKLMVIIMDHKTRLQYCFLAVILSYRVSSNLGTLQFLYYATGYNMDLIITGPDLGSQMVIFL